MEDQRELERHLRESAARINALTQLDRLMVAIGDTLADVTHTVEARHMPGEVRARVGRLIDSQAAVRSAITTAAWEGLSDG